MQKLERLIPRLAIEQQLQLHAQPGSQSRRHSLQAITRAPGPGPQSQCGLNLRQGIRGQIKTQASAVTGTAKNARGVIRDAVGMEKGQLTLSQMLPATVGIAELVGAIGLEQQSHGIHREVTTRKVLLDASHLHHRVLSRRGVGLRASAGHIQQHTINAQFGGAELRMQMQLGHTNITELVLQLLDEINS